MSARGASRGVLLALAIALLAALAGGCGRHLVGTNDVAIVVRPRAGVDGAPDAATLASRVRRRLIAGKLEADVDPAPPGAAQIVIDADERDDVVSLLRFEGLTVRRLDPTFAVAPADRAGLVERRGSEGSSERYFTGSRDAIRRVVAAGARRAAPAGLAVVGQVIDDDTARTRVVAEAPLATIAPGSADIATDGGNVLVMALDDEPTAAIARAREAVGDAPVALMVNRTVIDVAPLPRAPPGARATLRVRFGAGLQSFARAHAARRLLESPPLPALDVARTLPLPLRAGLATASLVLPLLLSLAWLVFVRRFDRAQPEPWWLVGATFGLGALSTVPVALVEQGLPRLSPYLDPSLMTLGGQTRAFPLALAAFVVTVGMVEEGGKLLGAWALAARRREFDEPVDGIVYGAASALGFAAVENVKYFTEGRLQSGIVAMRALESIPVHLFFGAIWGYALGRRLVDRRTRVVSYWLVAAIAHGLFDTCLSIERTAPLAPLVTLGLATAFVVLLRRALRYGRLRAEERGHAEGGARELFRVGSYARFVAYAGVVHVLGVAIVGAGITAEVLHHRPDAVEMVVIGVLVALMGASAWLLADSVPLDVVVDDAGVTFCGARRAWGSIENVDREALGRRATLLVRSPEGDVRLGPASPGAIDRIEGAVRARLAARVPRP